LKKKALLVGINKYEGAPLRGCVNDVTDMAEFLVGVSGFKKGDIRLLCDKRATQKEMFWRLCALVESLEPGDVGVFHYSGHGAQIASRDGAGEVDGLDELTCCVDFDWDNPGSYLTDNNYKDVFNRLKPGVKFLWLSDSCHSGDLTREMGGNKCEVDGVEIAHGVPRFIPPPVDIFWRTEGFKECCLECATNGSKMLRSTKINGAVHGITELNLVYISGCQDYQTSADAVFNKRFNGAMTRSFLDTVKKFGVDKTIRELHFNMNDALNRQRFTQRSDLEMSAALAASNITLKSLLRS